MPRPKEIAQSIFNLKGYMSEHVWNSTMRHAAETLRIQYPSFDGVRFIRDCHNGVQEHEHIKETHTC